MARRVGMRDLYVAKVTANTSTEYTTGTPERLTKAINGKVATKKSSEKVYSDDGVEEIVEAFESVEVEFEGNDLNTKMRELLFGHKIIKGMQVYNSDDATEEVAIGWRSKRSDGKYEFIWLYSGKFEEVEDEYETIADKSNPKTAKLKGVFYQRQKDKNYKVVVNESDLTDLDTEAKTVIQNWFSTVQEPLTQGV